MKLHLLDRASAKNSSFTVSMNSYPHFLKIWHHHPELELVAIKKSTGTRFIGDSIEKFVEGEVVLIGKNLPHMWLNDDVYFSDNSELTAEAIAVHFIQDFFGEGWLSTPEVQPIARLFELAQQGVKFEGLSPKTIDEIEGLLQLQGFDKAVSFVKILNKLAKHPSYTLLSSAGFVSSFRKSDDENLDRIYSFIFKNFNTPIHSKDVAEIAHMNPSAFSRFFKRVHRKTFTRYLNEIRVGFSCKLLMEHNKSVSEVCYESGFNNISNFNRQFKAITGMSPSDYVKLHT
ncbi:AraC family transcriptional regulator [Cytophaga sp. FL35]|uniref:AraC family transcriptional regulator n=1 Tax=Cytophaga sp. FL35 TaxID=1904456 RepID=UPI00165397D0|nr:AraC family transcriptional regulator [Cytophaga sp. FL35]MBC6997278.1 AraC family transcriptional regulator [Cytophaga sp. FL35]